LGGGLFPAPPALDTRYVFGWSGIEAAEARTTLRRGVNGVWIGTVTGGTKGWARSLYKLDAEYRAEVAPNDWRSLQTRQTENYRAYRTDEKAEFLPGGVRSWRESTKAGAKKPKWRNFYIEGIRDIAGALLLARSQPLRDTVRVEKREKINVRGEERAAIRASLGIESIEKDYALKPHQKFQRGTVWVSDDELRIPLRVEVKVFVGHVFAELADISTN